MQQQQIYRNRRMGHPKTEAERRATHKARFGTTKLPPRGTGLAYPSSYKKGGKVKKTGFAKVHKGEVVLTKKQAKSSPKIMQKHPGGTRTIKTSVRKRTATIVQKNREGGQKYRFPMPDKAHARNALARLPQAKGLTSEQKAKIRARAERMLGNKDRIKRSLRKTMGYA